MPFQERCIVANQRPASGKYMANDPLRAEVTGLLKAWSSGRPEALDKLIPAVHHELKHLAAAYMRRERPDHTLQATGLVNEAYLRLVEQREVTWHDRRHFYGIAAQCMRRVLVDYARQRKAEKRGGDHTFVALDESLDAGAERGTDLIALDDALATLARLDPRQAQVVELRYFGGLSIAETADQLQVSPATVKRDWESARVWLTCQLAG
jgi:RNA polymerase sigma factor (TIGR02999 family)